MVTLQSVSSRILTESLGVMSVRGKNLKQSFKLYVSDIMTLIYTFTIYNNLPQLIDATTVSITSFISILQIGMSKWKVCCCIICCKVSEAKFKVWKFHISSLISNRAGNEPSRSSQIQRRPLLHFPFTLMTLWRLKTHSHLRYIEWI